MMSDKNIGIDPDHTVKKGFYQLVITNNNENDIFFTLNIDTKAKNIPFLNCDWRYAIRIR